MIKDNKNLRRIITVITIVIALFGSAVGVIDWHTYEMNARAQWKINKLYVVDCMGEKQKENGWSDEETFAYGDRLSDSLGIAYPNKCPYCIVKSILH